MYIGLVWYCNCTGDTGKCFKKLQLIGKVWNNKPPASTTMYLVPGSKVGLAVWFSRLSVKLLVWMVLQVKDAASGSRAIRSWLLWTLSISSPCNMTNQLLTNNYLWIFRTVSNTCLQRGFTSDCLMVHDKSMVTEAGWSTNYPSNLPEIYR